MRPKIRLSAAIAALLLASAPAGALVHSASSSSASSASSTTAASAEAVTASVASAAITDSAAASTAVAAAEAVSADTVVADQTTNSSSSATIDETDEAGSTEITDVDRRCGDPESAQYEPPSGQGQPSCYNAENVFQPDNTYPAKYFSNELTCGTENELSPESTPVLTISGDGTGGAGGGGGFLQVCSDDELPVHGRITLAGDVSTGGSGQGSLTADGDNSNSPEQAKGWAQVNFGSGTPSVRCGKAHADGGRADSTNPTAEDTQEQCG